MRDKNKEGLIIDDGKIRECESNIAQMGFARTWWHFYGYRVCLRQLTGAADEVLDALKVLAQVGAFFLLIPILPFAQAFVSWRKALKAHRRDNA